MLYLHFFIYFDCKVTNKIGIKKELSNKNRLATKKVPKYLELSGLLLAKASGKSRARIFAIYHHFE
jgi:hypothetical protein